MDSGQFNAEPLLQRLTSHWGDVLGAPLSDEQLAQFARFGELLLEWNERLNLTAIVEPQEVVTKHFMDSLSVLAVLRPPLAAAPPAVIDVGTGGGFPGIPLKIARPEWRVTLLEATRKKTGFLAMVVRELGLEGVTIVWGRAEEVAHEPGQREVYDAAVARAVAELAALAELCLPFVRLGGQFVAQKGARVDEEVDRASRALELLGGRLVAIERLEVPGLVGEERALVAIKKVAPTPAKYPRRAGMPVKRPL
ncbi:MAG: 16S rRNA (guanine(527)-N(7))-methyltransferase RsmG [Ardenticatenaceae bacterium]|nr:16S rRNA (guanine(527)-N(7))-methyltransferase RsmG [Ardenticatenaceae bacterium]